MDSQYSITTLTDATFGNEVIQSEDLILVVFEAEWSGSCHILSPTMDALAAELSDSARVCRLDVDRSPSVSREYGISTLPTILFFQGGKVVDVLVGALPRDEIESRIASHVQIGE